MLARLVIAEQALTRAELAAELFAGADDPLGSLRWSLADLRRSLGLPMLLRGDPLTLTETDIDCDIWDVDSGMLPADGSEGILLDSVELRDCPEFDLWLLLARSHFSARLREALRATALRALAAGDPEVAVRAAERAARLEPLNESSQELFLRSLVAAGRSGVAIAHLAACEGLFAAEGIRPSPALRAAATPKQQRLLGVRAGVVAESLLRAGTAALDAGAADGGVETLRRAAEDAERAGDPALRAEVLRALGSALVHAVRGCDGEGAVILHQALLSARQAHEPAMAADILRELAFVDVQAGRHSSAARSLQEAWQEAGVARAGDKDAVLSAGLLAMQGMNEADQGHHHRAIALLTQSAKDAESAGRLRQRSWSLGVLARSLLLSGQPDAAQQAAEESLAGAHQQRWTAFQPWPQAILAECLTQRGERKRAKADAEEAFALGCELGDPCWEGMAGRALGVLAGHDGRPDVAWEWLLDARERSDRVSDRYVWISGYIGLAQLQLADRIDPELAPLLARQLRQEADRNDLPEFLAWALTYQATHGDTHALAVARATARAVDNPALRARIDLLQRGRTDV